METVSHNVADLNAADRASLERIVGHPLAQQSRVVIQIWSSDPVANGAPSTGLTADLPEWCDVYKGLSDDAVDELHQAISRRLNLTRQGN